LGQLGGLPYALDERSVGFAFFNFHFRPFPQACFQAFQSFRYTLWIALRG
jgi:hypothetical protein